MKILILKFRNIGDVLLSTPLIKNLKIFYPDAQIDFSLNKGTESMLTLNPNINKINIYDRENIKSLPFLKKFWKELRFFKSHKKEKYDVVINLTNGDRGNLISWALKAPIRIGYSNQRWFFRKIFTDELPKQGLRHTVEVTLDPLRVLDIPISTKLVEIFWSQKDEHIVNCELNNINNFIHVHAVSRWIFKCISDASMAQIIDYCEINLGIKVVLSSSNNNYELRKINNILLHVKSNPINLAGKLSLKQVAALNKKAQLFIGVDTSIMHISASNNTPTLAFFGPSGADHWGPWDNNLKKSSYSRRNGLQLMGMHRVFSESRSCQPCGNDGCNGTKISDCLMSMDLNKIQENILEMLNDK
jgi:heptosyltransferase III